MEPKDLQLERGWTEGLRDEGPASYILYIDRYGTGI